MGHHTHILTYRHFRATSLSNLHLIGLWKETGFKVRIKKLT